MNNIGGGMIQRSLSHVSCKNVRKSVSLALDWKHLTYSRHPIIGKLRHHVNSSSCYRSYIHTIIRSPDTNSVYCYRLPPYLSAANSSKYHHTSRFFYSGLTPLSANIPVNEYSSWQDDFENHHYSHVKQSKYRSLLSDIIRLLATLGLSYIAYNIVTHVLENSDLLPTAGCLSNESNLPQSVKLEGNPAQCPGSKKSFEESNQRKIAGEENEFGKISLQTAIERAQNLCQRRKIEVGSPGIVVCVSVDGKQVYAEGFGYADVENQIPLKPKSVLRIASISKAVTAMIVAKAWEIGKIDIEKAVQHYVPSFPEKEFMGEKVEITVQQLLSHSSGIRHYKSKDDPVYAFDKPITELSGIVKAASLLPFYKTGPSRTEKSCEDVTEKTEDQKSNDKKAEINEMERDEYYLTKHFSTTAKSLALFANDPLVARPGTRYVYTTFAYTLLAAVVESALKLPFKTVVTTTLQQIGLKETYLDLNDTIIYNRARYYVKDASGNIVNAPYVDNSYKWAGGGLLSTVEDVVKFGNVLLYSAQHQDGDPGPPGFLKSSSIWKFWTAQGVKGASKTYGLGFSIKPANKNFGMCDYFSFGVGHSGAAVGVSSALFILPRHGSNHKSDIIKNNNSKNLPINADREATSLQAVKDTPSPAVQSTSSACKEKSASNNTVNCCKAKMAENNVHFQKCNQTKNHLPQGVVVCVMLNMISVNCKDVAVDIARTFEKVDFTL